MRDCGNRAHRSVVGLLAIGLVIGCPALTRAADPLGRVIDQGAKRVEENAVAQQRVDRIADQKEDLLAQFRNELGVVEGLRVYNRLLTKQVDSQATEQAQLEASLQRVAEIERQILPLMLRMVESLKAFVALDLPFLPDERKRRISELETLLSDSGVPVAERLRRILEAYQIENEYGRTIESSSELIELDGRRQQVEMLRIGRAALIYRTPDRDQAGIWDVDSRSWQPLDVDTYGREIDRGIRLARRQAAPDLLLLPVPAPVDAASTESQP